MLRRVSWARFLRQVQINGRMHDMIGSDAAVLDTDTYELVIGEERVPVGSVVLQYRLVEEPEHGCPECQGMFATLSALGSHRSAAHGVKGARRQKGAAA